MMNASSKNQSNSCAVLTNLLKITPVIIIKLITEMFYREAYSCRLYK